MTFPAHSTMPAIIKMPSAAHRKGRISQVDGRSSARMKASLMAPMGAVYNQQLRSN